MLFRFTRRVMAGTPLLVVCLSLPQARGQELKSVGTNSFSAPKDILTPPADAHRLPSGIRYAILQAGSGADNPATNDCVILRFNAWHNDGSLFSTSGKQNQTEVQCLPASMLGVREVLKSMTAGARWRVWIPAALSFEPSRESEEGTYKDEALTIDLELVSILSAPITPIDLTTPPATAKHLPSAVRMQVLRAGSGSRHPSRASRVTVHYTGWTTQGKMFETTVMTKHPASILVGSALPGWRDGLLTMTPGEKARLWVPSALAYGDAPSDPRLPAGSLIFDIELLAID